MIPRIRPPLSRLVLAVVGLALAAPLAGQASYELPPDSAGPHTRHPEAQEAIDRLKSPYCPGQMLEVCTSAQGAALRDSIQDLAETGADADALVAWVLRNHGRQYLALPEARGAGLVAWVVPGLALLVGIGVVVVALRIMRRGRPEPVRDRELDPEEEARLRDALRQLDAEEQASL